MWDIADQNTAFLFTDVVLNLLSQKSTALYCTAGLSYLLVCVESCVSRPEWSLSPRSQPPGLVPLTCLQPRTKISHVILLIHLKPLIFLLDAVGENADADLR